MPSPCWSLPLCALLALAACAATAQAPWFQRSLVGIEAGPTGAQVGWSDPTDSRYAAQMDGRKIVRWCADANAEYAVVWARDGDYAYYQSKLLRVAPGLGTRDPLRDAVDEGRKRGITIVAYCVVQQGGHYLAAHPEYEMRGADGARLGRFCYNSGYLEDMKRIVAEQLAYGIAGFHIDMVDQGFGAPYGCWCDTCKRLFEAEYGHPMPAGVTWDAAWDDMLEFRYRTSERFEKALRAHIRTLDPAATVDYNYHGNPPFSWEVGQRPVQHAGNADFVTGETGMWGFSAITVGLNAQAYRAATPGLPYQVAIMRGARTYHDQTVRPLADLRWELFTLLAHGAFVTVVDKLAFDGGMDPVAYERIGAAFAETRRKREHFGQPPVYDVGLYFSARSRDWTGRSDPPRYFQGFQGAHKTCVHSHLVAGVLLDENVTAEALQQYPVVCLPGVTILSQREVALLRDYVEAGGRLVVTGQSGQFGPRGEPLEESLLAQLIGARVVRRLDTTDNWVRLDEKGTAAFPALREGVPLDWNVLVRGPATVYAPTTATAVGRLLAPYRTTRQKAGTEGVDWPQAAEAEVGPAILVNRVGKGTVLTFAGSPDHSVASEFHVTETRALLRNALRMLRPNPRVEVEAPATVEAVVTDDAAARELRVHFIAYNSLPQTMPAFNRPYVLPGLVEEAPMYRATIRAGFAVKGAQAAGAGASVKRRGRTVELTAADIHTVVVLRY